MSPERWRRAEQIYNASLEMEPGQREAFLEEACSGDDPLRREVESLLEAYEKAGSFLSTTAMEAEIREIAADLEQSLEGEQLGHYEVLSRLGAGAMGEVYLAHDTKLERSVAIKLLPARFTQDADRLQRFMREAKTASALNHPNIITIYEIGETRDTHYIAAEFVEGSTLRKRLENGRLELHRALDIAIQVAAALDAAHCAGIVHRDIKPENIMVRPDGLVKVLDFGLAKLTGERAPAGGARVLSAAVSTESGVVMGTPRYMSPEQARGLKVDARTDIFSLGVVLYETLSGKAPFVGDTAADWIAALLDKEPEPPSRYLDEAPAELDRIFKKALAKNYQERYQTARDLQSDLLALGRKSELQAQFAHLRYRTTQFEVDRVKDAEPGVSASNRPSVVGKVEGTNGWHEVRPHSPAALSKRLRRPLVFILAALAASAMALLATLEGGQLWRATPHHLSPNAVYWYDQGTNALRDGSYYKASKALERAIQLDNKFALAHARLAEAWTELDYTDKAKDEIIRAETLVPDHSMLPPVEALYLQAITKTVLGEFAPAIESYREIVRRSPDREKPLAYVDLGRAYEKNEEVEKAVESYREVTKLLPEDPAAFLRLGILHTQQQDVANATEAFQKAEALYQALRNFEGIAEALYQRSVLLTNLSKLAEARAQLEQSLEVARVTDNKHQQIRILLQLARVYYSRGEATRAQQYAAEAKAQARGMENLSTQSLIELGNAVRAQGDFGEAERYLKEALNFAQVYKGRRSEAMALLALGRLRMRLHDPDGGLRYIEQALAFYQRGGYRKEASRALILLGDANDLKGDYDAALRSYEQQFQLAQSSGAQSVMAVLHERIGFVLAHQERYSDALHRFDESYAINTSMNKQLMAVNSIINRGDMLWRLGRYEEARAALSQASLVAERPDNGNRQLTARIYLIAAQMALSERRFSQAKSQGRLALASNAETGHAVEAKYTLGLAQSFSGLKREGRLMCEEAVEEATHAGDPRMLSDALLALAEAMLESGDAKRALSTALQAQESFTRAGRQESEWRAWAVAARAGQRAGNEATVRQSAPRAEGLLLNLRQKWGEEIYNAYLTRPDVRQSRKRLSQLLAENK